MDFSTFVKSFAIYLITFDKLKFPSIFQVPFCSIFDLLYGLSQHLHPGFDEPGPLSGRSLRR